MRAYVVEHAFGILAIDDRGEVIDKVIFQRDPRGVAEKLVKLKEGEIIGELEDLLRSLSEKSVKEIILERSYPGLREKFPNLDVRIETPSEGGKLVRSNLLRFARMLGFDDYYDFLHEVCFEMTKIEIKGAITERDVFVIQAVEALDDLDRIINMMIERLRVWYSIHFPELNDIVKNHELFARLVAGIGNRNRFSEETLKKFNVPSDLISKILRARDESVGAEIGEEDLSRIRTFAEEILDLYSLRESITNYLEETVREVAPNLAAIAGPKLAARLMSLAGGLEKLAKLPASTIQVLGAEKALFRHLRYGTKPPKHGVIFQHPLIFRAPKWQRGKIARTLAAKLAIAARVDFYSGEYIADELLKDIRERVEEIKKKYPKPPKKRKREKAKRAKR